MIRIKNKQPATGIDDITLYGPCRDEWNKGDMMSQYDRWITVPITGGKSFMDGVKIVNQPDPIDGPADSFCLVPKGRYKISAHMSIYVGAGVGYVSSCMGVAVNRTCIVGESRMELAGASAYLRYPKSGLGGRAISVHGIIDVDAPAEIRVQASTIRLDDPYTPPHSGVAGKVYYAVLTKDVPTIVMECMIEKIERSGDEINL